MVAAVVVEVESGDRPAEDHLPARAEPVDHRQPDLFENHVGHSGDEVQSGADGRSDGRPDARNAGGSEVGFTVQKEPLEHQPCEKRGPTADEGTVVDEAVK